MKPVDTFNAYFAAFEKAYLDNAWERIAPYFAPDITYNTAGGDVAQGRAAAIDYLRNDVDSLDRRFDVREFVGEPDISGDGDQVTMVFTVRYRKAGLPDLEIGGKEVATIKDGQIQQLDDLFDEGALAGFAAWMHEHGAQLA